MFSIVPKAVFALALATCAPALASHAFKSQSEQGAWQKGSLRLGIGYEIAPGECGDQAKKPLDNWLCEIKIRGSLTNGTVFLDRTDSSSLLTLYPGFNNFEESLGLNVFPELSLLGQGGKMKLYVEAAAGFGASTRGTVSPGSDLVYEIELMTSCDLDAQEKTELERERSYFKKLLAENNSLVFTPCGIFYEILNPGSERKAQPSDICEINLTATLSDQTPILTDEKLRLYKNFYNSDNNLVIRSLSEVGLLGEGGKIRLYIPFNQGFRHYKKAGIPAYSTLIYDIELTRTIDTEAQAADPFAYLPKQYCFYEQYPMLLRQAADQGNTEASWAFAIATTLTLRLGKELLDFGLVPPATRSPILRNDNVIGYTFADKKSEAGRLSSQQLISLVHQYNNTNYGSTDLGTGLNAVKNHYLVCEKIIPFENPSSPDATPPSVASFKGAETKSYPLPIGGHTKRISISAFYKVQSDENHLKDSILKAPITIGLKHWDKPNLQNHFKGMVVPPTDSSQEDAGEGNSLVLGTAVGWGEEEGQLYWIVELNRGAQFFHDDCYPCSLENFNHALIRVAHADGAFLSDSSCFSFPEMNIKENGIRRKLVHSLDTFNKSYRDGYLPWPYLKP